MAERRRKLTPDKLLRFLDELAPLKIVTDVEGIGHSFSSILDLARRYQRSSYDAAYLELALRLGLPLATKDEPLRQAAESLAIPLYAA